MNSKTHPLSIFFGLTLMIIGVFFIQIAFLRFETLIRDFSYVLLNVFLVFNLFGLSFFWIGLSKFYALTITKDTLVKKYWFGLMKKNYLLDNKSHYSFHVRNYFLFKHRSILIENAKEQQIRFSNFSILNFNETQNYTKEQLRKKEIKFRINSSDKILIYSHFILFVWLIISYTFNLTF